MPKEKILILDFGSQYNQLIARKVREQNVFCEIVPPTIDIRSINREETKGIRQGTVRSFRINSKKQRRQKRQRSIISAEDNVKSYLQKITNN